MQVKQSVLLTYREAAAFLGVCENTLRKLVLARVVPHVRYPGSHRVHFVREHLQDWVLQRSLASVRKEAGDGQRHQE